MVAEYSPPGGGKAGPGSPSELARRSFQAQGGISVRGWPREVRLLRRTEFVRVYSGGRRYSSPFFAAFLLKTESPTSKVGFTIPRGLGCAVRRNRIKRRMREAVRLHLAEIAPGWNIVFHPRQAVLGVEFYRLEQEVSRFFGSLTGRESRP